MTKRILPLAALLALAACSQEATDADIDIDNRVNAAETATVDNAAVPQDETPPPPVNEIINEADDAGSEQPSPPNTPEAAMIPGQYRGRWGMNAADCDQARADNKGMITIGEKSVRFYESTAILKERRPAVAISFSGLFAFTGEGQSWEKVMTFTRTGDMLKRADDHGTYNYRRCS